MTKKLEYTINKKIINHYHFDSIGSTQIYSKEQKNNFKPNEVNIFSTNIQTNGIGQNAKKWISCDEPLNLFVTYGLLLNEKFSENKNLIPYAAVCSVVDLLLTEKIESKIKWVNDVLINKKKICGVLVESFNESSLRKDEKYASVHIGIGINVNSSESHLAELENKATSMKIETKRDFDMEHLLSSLSSILLDNLDGLFLNGFDKFRKKINSKLEKFDNQKIKLKNPDNTYHFGYIQEIGNDGELIILNEDGKRIYFINGGSLLPLGSDWD